MCLRLALYGPEVSILAIIWILRIYSSKKCVSLLRHDMKYAYDVCARSQQRRLSAGLSQGMETVRWKPLGNGCVGFGKPLASTRRSWRHTSGCQPRLLAR